MVTPPKKSLFFIIKSLLKVFFLLQMDFHMLLFISYKVTFLK